MILKEFSTPDLMLLTEAYDFYLIRLTHRWLNDQDNTRIANQVHRCTEVLKTAKEILQCREKEQ